ncbi:hypothetical protein STAS_25634 [Striga asiatica]|uniref:Uncharacterized protein n=1 Tax=Striga asiatica TaxID=4170 RepID=A0A5A7QU87_STRAF|nr:hypothetical protein STAS_25634 [Striga asiatica]
MSFFKMNIGSGFGPNFDEHKWVHQIRKHLDDELEEETEIPITIFGDPKAMITCSPESYIPQEIAIGPYHHFRAEVYDMERYKVAAAKRTQKELQDSKLQDIVEHLVKFDLRIRAGYHRPVGFGAEALAWMMAVDACFLLEFFQVCGLKMGKVLTKNQSTLSRLTDLSTNKNANAAILRDIVMLENQIPLFVMRMLLEFRFSSLDIADQLLLDMLIGLGNEILPFKTDGTRKIEVKECAHLLDFLYRSIIVPEFEAGRPDEIIEICEDGNFSKTDSFSEPGHVSKIIDVIWNFLSSLKAGPALDWIKRILVSKPLKVVVKLPWTILTKIPIVKTLKGPIESAFGAFTKDKEKKEDEKSSSDKPPVLEEITIPSVSQLFGIGVQFVPTDKGIMGISFDSTTKAFYIPVIELDVNSEVVLRNLVAYEACARGPLVLTRFTELMNGIVDTEEDVRMLCGTGIIVNRLKGEKEVAEMWNGMSRSVGLTKVPLLDKVIGEVNGYYNGRWKVRIGNLVRRYVFGSWKILTFVAAAMMLLLMCLQAFCQVYSCSRIVPIKALEPLNGHE